MIAPSVTIWRNGRCMRLQRTKSLIKEYLIRVGGGCRRKFGHLRIALKRFNRKYTGICFIIASENKLEERVFVRARSDGNQFLLMSRLLHHKNDANIRPSIVRHKDDLPINGVITTMVQVFKAKNNNRCYPE